MEQGLPSRCALISLIMLVATVYLLVVVRLTSIYVNTLWHYCYSFRWLAKPWPQKYIPSMHWPRSTVLDTIILVRLQQR